MNHKRQSVVSILRKSLNQNPIWSEKLAGTNGFKVHMAIFREPYLSFIMEGKKKVETRFAKRACPPFGRVADGDVVLLKKAGGAIIGICEVEKVWFYHLDPKSFASIKERFGELICPENASFWIERKTKAVATLMLVKNVFPVKGLTIEKRDRRGWVVFEEENQMCLFQE